MLRRAAVLQAFREAGTDAAVARHMATAMRKATAHEHPSKNSSTNVTF